jgi:hypothetical protein
MQALYSNTTGYQNTANGMQALYSNTTGYQNTANGMQALYSNTTGYQNTANGMYALYRNITGYNNTADGMYALYLNQVGVDNVSLGTNSLYSNSKSTVATAIVTGGQYIILTLGTTDFTLVGASVNTVGVTFTANATAGLGTGTVAGVASNNTALGYQALYANEIYQNVTGVGANTAVTGSNQVQLGDSATTTYAYGAVQDRSDIRDKADVRDTTLGLAFIESLRPVDFKWDKREDYRTQPPVKPEYPVKPSQPVRVDSLQLKGGLDADYRTHIDAEWQTTLDVFEADYKALTDIVDAEFAIIHDEWLNANKLVNITHNGTHKRSRYHHGVIAQEVPAEFGGLQNHSLKGGDDVWSVGYEEFIAPLIKAVQELSSENKMLKLYLGFQ